MSAYKRAAVSWGYRLLLCFVLYSTCSSCKANEGTGPDMLPKTAERRVYHGKPRWKLSEVFTSRTISISCDQEAGAKTCNVTISPYGTTHLAVVHQNDLLRLQNSTPPGCKYIENSDLSLQLILSGFVGLILFALAPILAASIAFRISVGGLLSILLCTLAAAIIAVRHARPNSIAAAITAGLAAFGATASSILGLWFRFPDIPSLLSSRLFLAYAVASFLVGAAVSYYFDSHDEKIIDIIAAGLRLCGGALVYYSASQLWEVAMVAVALLAALLLLQHGQPGKSTGILPSASPSPLVPSPVDLTLPARSVSHSGDQDSPGTGDTPPPLKPPLSAPAGHVVQAYEHRSEGGTRPGSEGGAPAAASSWFRPRSAMTAPVASPGRDSPLLEAGLVCNQLTGRTIKIGGGTYSKLLDQGFIIDRAAGMIVPPAGMSPRQAAGAAASPGGEPRGSRSGARRRSARVGGDTSSPMGRGGASTVTSPY